MGLHHVMAYERGSQDALVTYSLPSCLASRFSEGGGGKYIYLYMLVGSQEVVCLRISDRGQS